MNTKFVLTAALITLASSAYAQAPGKAAPSSTTHFSNEYLDFDLPDNWSCAQGDSEWACHPNAGPQRSDALIVFVGKLRSPDDSMEKYQEHLSKPITVKLPDGSTATSQPKDTHSSTIGGMSWVDSMHSDSEVKGYYTRYLATIKEDIGVLITYSIQKQKFDKYSKALESTVRSIKVHRDKPAPVAVAASGAAVAQNTPGLSLGSAGQPAPIAAFPKDTAPVAQSESGHGGSTAGGGLLLLLLVGGGGFYYYKKKKASGG